jgi:ribosomal protein S18 acetylase RimI-like enzyme
MNLSIRKITMQDLDAIKEIFIRTYSIEPWSETWDNEILQERLSDFINNTMGLNFCAYNEDGNIVGVMFGRRMYWIRSKEYYVEEFFIDPKIQRQGIGTFMVDKVSEKIKEDGYGCMILNTEKDYPSEKFYLKNGFHQKVSNIFMYKDI